MHTTATKVPHEQQTVDTAEGTTVQFQDGRPEAAKQLKVKEWAQSNAGVNRLLQLKSFLAGNTNLAPIQLQTKIDYHARAFNYISGREIVGSQMRSELDPNDKKHGSAPGSNVQSGLMGALKTMGFKRMIRGHLMNGQLGGLGIAANLFPITSQANSKHKYAVENKVKQLIKEGKKVKYNVDVHSDFGVTEEDDDYEFAPSVFRCHVELVDSAPANRSAKVPTPFDVDVTSTPGKSARRGRREIEGAAVDRAGSGIATNMSFASRNLPKGWGQSGHGYQTATHGDVRGHSSFTFHPGGGDAPRKMDPDSFLTDEGYDFHKGGIDRFAYARELVGQIDWKSEAEAEEMIDTIDDLERDKDNRYLEEYIADMEKMKTEPSVSGASATAAPAAGLNPAHDLLASPLVATYGGEASSGVGSPVSSVRAEPASPYAWSPGDEGDEGDTGEPAVPSSLLAALSPAPIGRTVSISRGRLTPAVAAEADRVIAASPYAGVIQSPLAPGRRSSGATVASPLVAAPRRILFDSPAVVASPVLGMQTVTSPGGRVKRTSARIAGKKGDGGEG